MTYIIYHQVNATMKRTYETQKNPPGFLLGKKIMPFYFILYVHNLEDEHPAIFLYNQY